jgi:hypothetical protein
MTRSTTVVSLAFACLLVPPGAVHAQDWPGALEVTAGGMLARGYPLGSAAATLTENQVPAGDFTLFRTESEIRAAPGFQLRVAYGFTRGLAVEAGVEYSKPQLRTSISGDPEQGTPLAAAETIDQYVVDVRLLVHLVPWAFAGGRAVPFASAGAGYLRQLHEGHFLVETGQVVHIGGGLKYLLNAPSRSWLKGVGLRGDAAVVFKREGVDVADATRQFATVGGGLFLRF